MKGIIFNATEEAVVELFSADTWDDLLAASGCTGAYTALGNYPDTELVNIVMAASEATGQTPADVMRVVGEHAFAPLADRYPEFLEGHDDVLAFIRSVNEIIHPEVLKLYPESSPPGFDFSEVSDDAMTVTYRSARCMGALAEGLMLGAARHFGTPIAVEVLEGDGTAETRFRVRRAA